MERSLAVLAQEEPDEDVAALAAQLGRFLFFAGDTDRAVQRIETALDLSEALSLPEVLAQALNTKSLLLLSRGRSKESLLLVRYALEVALEHDKPSAALRAFYNLADFLCTQDSYEDAAKVSREGLAHARRVGNRYWEWLLLGFGYPFYALGQWDEVLEMQSGLPEEDWSQARLAFGTALVSAVPVCIHRGRLDEARRLVDLGVELEKSADVQERSQYGFAKSILLLAHAETAEALQAAEGVFELRASLPLGLDAVKEAFPLAVQAALELDRLDKANELLAVVDELPPGRRPQFFDAHVARFRAQLAQRRGETDEAERLFKRAGALFQELALPFHLAVTRLEHAEWLAMQTRAEEAQPVLAEAREIFERLQAKPWLERLGQPASLRHDTEAVTAGS
jgi:tetratricopeptide (TPR) repeat protein